MGFFVSCQHSGYPAGNFFAEATLFTKSKDNNNAQSSNTTSTSPLELLTWGTVLLELILLLIKLKITEI